MVFNFEHLDVHRDDAALALKPTKSVAVNKQHRSVKACLTMLFLGWALIGRDTADARESMARIQASLSRWERASFSTAEGDTSFELHLPGHPVLSTIASLGGSLEEAVIEDGDYQLTIHVAPSTDVN